MALRANPLGRMVNNYLMKMGLPVAVWFIVEYLLRNAATRSLPLNLLIVPLMLLTPFIFFRVLRSLRREVLNDMMLGIQAWTFGVQLAFFAGVVEALFIYVYNQFLFPTAIADNLQATTALYEQMIAQLKEAGAYSSMWNTFDENLKTLNELPVPTAIETAISTLSNEIMMAMLYMVPLAFMLRKKPDMN